MEKFALLNLLKAIDGLQNADIKSDGEKKDNKDMPSADGRINERAASPVPSFEKRDIAGGEKPISPQVYQNNILYGALMRHEEMSNRLRRKR